MGEHITNNRLPNSQFSTEFCTNSSGTFATTTATASTFDTTTDTASTFDTTASTFDTTATSTFATTTTTNALCEFCKFCNENESNPIILNVQICNKCLVSHGVTQKDFDMLDKKPMICNEYCVLLCNGCILYCKNSNCGKTLFFKSTINTMPQPDGEHDLCEYLNNCYRNVQTYNMLQNGIMTKMIIYISYPAEKVDDFLNSTAIKWKKKMGDSGSTIYYLDL